MSFFCKRTFRLLLANIVLISFFATLPRDLFAFTRHRGNLGPLTFEIAKIEPITAEGQIYRAPLTVENASDQDVEVVATFSSIESFFLIDDSGGTPLEIVAPNTLTKKFVVKARSTYETDLAFVVRNAYRDAHYPARATFSFKLNQKRETLELRPVFATKITSYLSDSVKLKPLELKQGSYLRLSGSNTRSFAPYWKRFDGDFVQLPIGWTGSESQSLCSLSLCSMTRGGVSRESWSIHPPYSGGPGVVGLRFVVALPKSNKIELRFNRAMRDVYSPEPPTDGVIFRVYATPLNESDNLEATIENALALEPDPNAILLDEQYAETVWSEVKVDLSQFTGRLVLLTFEADPGAKRDTTCDNSFWGDATLVSEPQNETLLSPQEREQLRIKNKEAFQRFVSNDAVGSSDSGFKLDETSRGFVLDDGQRAVVTLGSFGVCDGWIIIGSKERNLQIDGIRARYQGSTVGFEPSYSARDVFVQFVESSKLEKAAQIFARERGSAIIGDLPVDANFSKEDLDEIKSFDNPQNALACFISKTAGGLAFRFVATRNEEIESLQFGPFSEKAKRVYFGHGHCIVEPSRPFTQDGDGFGCSSSHVGFDFANGLSLLQATTRPVESFIVNPDLNIYTLSTSPDSRLTLRSGENGAMDCAIKYAKGFDKRPAPLVAQKAGRFVYDYWGSSFANVLERMKTFYKYGLTDALLIQHVWQRYGYDVCLPDVWPPDPGRGTLRELKETQAFCDKIGVPFGLHDNYIDFYPDADNFSYDDVIINPDGQPQKAWYNPGPDVQSYRFKPTAIFPYANRNLDLIRKDLMQTAYFTDVFSSIHIMNFYDREGKYHSRAETLESWNKYFDLVREKFNDNAITVSESGNDALIGHLDGADAILRRITPTQENYSTVIPCADNEYVPWFDAVTHNKFSLHGVGYSDRYQGGLSRALRGIESDDYLSAEVLTGHALMVDLATSKRGTVRKYWLLQKLARSLAMDEIVDFKFFENDVHRQIVTWKSGVVVYINRGIDDWELADLASPNPNQKIVLPRFGFWTVNQNGSSYGGIVKNNNQIVEMRVDEDGFFVNGRQVVPNQVVPIRPSYEEVELVDESTIRGRFIWEAFSPTDKPYSPFLHLERPQTWWADKPELTVLPLGDPNKPSDTWKGRESNLFGELVAVRVPDSLEPGYYNLLCGLYDKKTGRRLPLLGSGTNDSRYRLGAIIIEGRGKNRKLTFEQTPDLRGIDLRLAPNKEETDFGVCETAGAFRCETKSEKSRIITPLPAEPSFTVSLKTPFFQSGSFEIIERNSEGDVTGHSASIAKNNRLTIQLDSSKVFSYEIIKR